MQKQGETVKGDQIIILFIKHSQEPLVPPQGGEYRQYSEP